MRAAVLLLLVTASCVGTGGIDESAIAAAPPLPYRVALCGGAFLPPRERAAAGTVPEPGPGVTRIFSRTYPSGVAEPIEFTRIADVLRRGRCATRLLVPPFDAALREAVAAGDAAATARARRWAEANGADLLLVVEGLGEGPIEMQGVTGQWLVTSVAWVLVGLGMFIPDHRFEAKVSLKATLRDAHSGRVIGSRILVAPGTMDLALINRTDFLGILQSVIVPPTLVANDVESVVSEVRTEGDRRLLLRLLAELKDPPTLEEIRGDLAMRLEVREVSRRGVQVTLESAQELQGIAVELTDAAGRALPYPADRAAEFRRALLASAVTAGRRFRYEARIAALPARAEVRVLVQNAAGQRTSSTVRLAK